MNLIRTMVLATIAGIGFQTVQAQYATYGQPLADALAHAPQEELLPVLVLLSDAVDMPALKRSLSEKDIPAQERPREVMRTLKAKARTTQPPLISFIEESGFAYARLRTFWISNSLALDAGSELIEALASRPEVAYMALDRPAISLIAPEKVSTAQAKSEGGSEPGLAVIGAPEMWALGYTGNGRLAMTFDTGVWPDHPSFADRFLPNRMPYDRTWFAYDSPIPVDKTSSHGTHVSGTMIGLDAATADTIGVAPRAYLIATDPVVSNLAFLKPLSDFMFGYEWALNPDGDEDTFDDVPDVINNSWGYGADLGEPPCPEFVVPVFDAVEAAGIANVFSAGNEGPEAETMSVPHNINTGLVNSFTVGAVNGNSAGPDYAIANFSSRGPSLCGGEGSLLIKPEVCAPGVGVRSSVENGAYDSFSGTSMAAPHVSGAVLLLKEAFPFLTGEELLLALYQSAVDQGAPGEDNTYGMGLINVKAAFEMLAEEFDPVPPASPEVDAAIVALRISSAIGSPGEAGPQWRCSHTGYDMVQPVARVTNLGTLPLEGLAIRYRINAGEELEHEAPSLLLAPGDTAEVELPAIAIAGVGPQELHAYVSALEDEYDPFNNHYVHRWQQLSDAYWGNDSFEDGFENGLNNDWFVVNPDNQITWDSAWVVQANGEMGYAAWMDMANYNPIANQRDYLISPVFEPFETIQKLSFDYFYHKRSNNEVQFDTLVISAAYNCGESLLEIARIGGEDLWTVGTNQANAFPDDASEWMHLELDWSIYELDVFYPEGGFYVVFETINRRGNHLLIDNVFVSNINHVDDRSHSPSVSLTIAPNPATVSARIDWSGSHSAADLYLYDLRGVQISAQTAFAKNGECDLSAFAQGVYVVKALFRDGSQAVGKLIVH